MDYLNSTLPRFKQAGGLCQITIIMRQGQCPSTFAAASMNCNNSTARYQILLITIYIMPRTMSIGHSHRVISIHVNFHTFRYVFHQFSCIIREELICHSVSEKGVRTIHKAPVYTSFQRPEQGVRLIYGCILYTRNYGIYIYI